MFGIMWDIIGITPHIKIKQYTFNDMSLNKNNLSKIMRYLNGLK